MVPTLSTPLKANYFHYQFSGRKFTGDLLQLVELDFQNYKARARQHGLTAVQKVEYFTNVLEGSSRTFLVHLYSCESRCVRTQRYGGICLTRTGKRFGTNLPAPSPSLGEDRFPLSVYKLNPLTIIALNTGSSLLERRLRAELLIPSVHVCLAC